MSLCRTAPRLGDVSSFRAGDTPPASPHQALSPLGPKFSRFPIGETALEKNQHRLSRVLTPLPHCLDPGLTPAPQHHREKRGSLPPGSRQISAGSLDQCPPPPQRHGPGVFLRRSSTCHTPAEKVCRHQPTRGWFYHQPSFRRGNGGTHAWNRDQTPKPESLIVSSASSYVRHLAPNACDARGPSVHPLPSPIKGS